MSIIFMNSCSSVVEKTKNRLILVGPVTLANGWLNKDLRVDSLTNNYIELAKYVWHNDEKARNEAIAAVLCKLGI